MDTEQDAGKPGPRTPLRVVELLHELAASADNLSLSDLSRRLGIPKSSTLNLVRALQAVGYVELVDGLYRLGGEALKLAAIISTNQRRNAALHAVLQRLTATTGETSQLSILAPDAPVALCIDLVDSPQPLRYSLYIGLRRPLYCTSIGKLILAFAAPDWVARYFAQLEPVSYNENTQTDPELIQAQLPRIRQTGLSLSHEGMIIDASGMSAAVFGVDGAMTAGLTIAAPSSRMRPNEARFRESLLAAAREASTLNGYVGAYPPVLLDRKT